MKKQNKFTMKGRKILNSSIYQWFLLLISIVGLSLILVIGNISFYFYITIIVFVLCILDSIIRLSKNFKSYKRSKATNSKINRNEENPEI